MKHVTKDELVKYFEQKWDTEPSWSAADAEALTQVLNSEQLIANYILEIINDQKFISRTAGFNSLFVMAFMSGVEFENERFVQAMKRDRALLYPPATDPQPQGLTGLGIE